MLAVHSDSSALNVTTTRIAFLADRRPWRPLILVSFPFFLASTFCVFSMYSDSVFLSFLTPFVPCTRIGFGGQATLRPLPPPPQRLCFLLTWHARSSLLFLRGGCQDFRDGAQTTRPRTPPGSGGKSTAPRFIAVDVATQNQSPAVAMAISQ